MNKPHILFKSQTPLFLEICSNPIYYETLHSFGLVSRETINKAFEITKNMSAYTEKYQADGILKVYLNFFSYSSYSFAFRSIQSFQYELPNSTEITLDDPSR